MATDHFRKPATMVFPKTPSNFRLSHSIIHEYPILLPSIKLNSIPPLKLPKVIPRFGEQLGQIPSAAPDRGDMVTVESYTQAPMNWAP